MVNVIVLCIELLLDVVGLVLGIIVFSRSSDNRLQKVIADVGISSRAYFYKEFTRKFGMTPKVYREKTLENDGRKGRE